MDTISKRLLETGLVQFGLFENPLTGYMMPYRLRLELLAAYPILLRQAADDALAVLDDNTLKADRLVSTSDAIPLSVLINQQTGVPLVYSRGCGDNPVHDLIGAYDVGHPAVLITNTVDDSVNSFIQKAGRVGLIIEQIVVLMDTGYRPDDVTVRCVWSLDEIVIELATAGQLPAGQAKAVRELLRQKSAP